MADTNPNVANIEQRMESISKKFRGDGNITIVFIVVIILGIGYFWYGFSQIAPAAEPEELVSLLAGPIDDKLEELRVDLTKMLVDAAPGIAEDLSSQAIEGMPAARKALEGHIIAQLETEIETLISTGETEFVKILQENKEEFERTLDDLADNQDATDTTVEIFFEAIKKEMGQDMHDQAQQVLGTLIALREKGESLASGSGLNFVSHAERRILMTARRLQLTEADPGFVKREKKRADAKAKAIAEEAAANAAKEAVDDKKDDADDKKDDADDKKDDADAKKDDADAKKDADAKADDSKEDAK
jgi:hypothetical protein